MSTLNHKTLCVVNPASANGRTRKAWVKVEQAMAKRGLELEAQHIIPVARVTQRQ